MSSMSSKEKDKDKKFPRFQEGERILCFHGPLIYEGKCLKVRKNNSEEEEYLIHYAGWSKSWDEWVTDLRILKYNEQNLTRQRELSNAYKDAKKIRCKAALSAASGVSTTNVSSNIDSSCNYRFIDAEEESRSSTPTSTDNNKYNGNQSTEGGSENGSTSSKKKRRMDIEPGVETEEQFSDKVEIKVKIPDELKPWLVDDWDLICRQKKLIQLPCKTTVDNIIENYIKQKATIKSSTGAMKESAAVQTANSIKEYFNATLGSQLLYKYERLQYAQILERYHPNQAMSSVYGAAHLLRLFVILGSLIVYTQINDKTVQVLKSQLQDFLKYLLKNTSTLFSIDNYEYATAEYQRNSS